MSIKIDDKDINTPQLVAELKAAGLAQKFGVRRTTGVGIEVWGEGLDDATVRATVAAHTPKYATPVAVKQESERRKNAGTLIGGKPFRCDDASLTRIQGLATRAQRLEDASQAVNIVFKTNAGDTVTVTSAAQAWAMFDAASAFVAVVLEASAGLQDTLPEDFAADIHWPE
jgi:hypothetical protein